MLIPLKSRENVIFMVLSEDKDAMLMFMVSVADLSILNKWSDNIAALYVSLSLSLSVGARSRPFLNREVRKNF